MRIISKLKAIIDLRKIERLAHRANVRNLFKAAALIRITARRSIRQRRKPSEPGKPPSTQTRRLKNAIKFAVDSQDESAIIGTDSATVGPAGAAHEFGGQFRNEEFPERPFMQPALDKSQERFVNLWADSVRER